MRKSAGIVVVRYFDDEAEPRVLCLKIYSSYDLPKGHVEDDESTIETALRETAEEAGITELDFKWGYVAAQVTNDKSRRKKQVTMFVASTEQDAKLVKNPKTKKYEHHAIAWMTFDEAIKSVHPYLSPIISWAKEKVLSGVIESL